MFAIESYAKDTNNGIKDIHTAQSDCFLVFHTLNIARGNGHVCVIMKKDGKTEIYHTPERAKNPTKATKNCGK